MRTLALLLAALAGASACSTREPARHYPIRGQILAIGDNAVVHRPEVTVKHEDIPGFMPAMTMAYFLKEGVKPDGLAPGDLFTATLVVDGGSIYLDGVRKTGQAPLPADAHRVKIMDVMAPGDEVPAVALTDQTGARHTLSDWRGKALVVTFVYTRCPVPDFCPLMDKRFGELQKAVGADATLAGRVHLASISFDPRHDTPAVIADHAKARGADPRVWSYLTGDAEGVDLLTSRFGVSTIDEHDTPESITHNLRTAIVDPRGRLVTVHTGNDWTVDGLLNELRAQIH